MKLAELRGIMNESSMINESIDDYILDEAYFGVNAVDPILNVMADISLAVKANPNIKLNNDKLNTKLQDAVQKVFGFKKVKIFWANNPSIGMGPYTITSSVILHSGSGALAYGSNSTGFYDENAELDLYVNMDNQLFVACDLTPKEATAILLHEIGHNFDYSAYNIINSWSVVIQIISTLARGGNIASNKLRLQQLLVQTLGVEYGKNIIGAAMNIPEYISNLIPPVGVVIRGFRKISFNITKFINNLFSPISILITIPVAAIMTPLMWLGNFFTRKKEVFADSFAASYGYASELATALDKLDKTLTGANNYQEGTFMAALADLTLVNRDIICLAQGGHTTTQRRLIKMIDKLEKDIASGKYDPSLKKELQRQLENSKETYNTIIGLDGDKKNKFTSYVRQLFDSWYAGKPYMAINSFNDEYAE